MPRFVARVSALAMLALAVPVTSYAQSWQFEPKFRVGGEYDDNATLNIRTDEEVELTGLQLDVRANMIYGSDTTTFNIEPRGLFRDYGSDSEYDSNDLFLRSSMRYEGQANTLGFRAFFAQQDVRTAERAIADSEIEDPEDIIDDDTSLVILEGDRDKLRFSPFWTYRLSNISSIGVDVDFFNTEYSGLPPGTLSDYTDTRLNLTYRRAFSSVNTSVLRLTGRNFDTDASGRDITGYGIQGGFEYDLSEKTEFRGLIGVEDTDQSGADTDLEVVGELTLIRRLETIRTLARYKRSINSGGGGRLTIRDSVTFNFRRRLSERISAGFGVRAYQSEAIDKLATFDDREYLQLQSSFLWYLAEAYVIEAEYRYTINDRSTTIGERANSNQINLWFTYQPRTVPDI